MTSKPYPSYRDSGIPAVDELPAHWRVARLKHVATVQTGIAKGKDLTGVETASVPYLRVANVQDGFFALDDVASIDVPVADVDRYLLRAGDVLMNEGGDNDKLGRGHIWTGGIAPCVHQNHVFAVRPHRVTPHWLNTVTGSSYAQFFFLGRAKQSTNLASISSTNLMELPVILPPADEQQAIATFLDRETAKIDALVAEQERLIALLAEKRQAEISHAVTKGLDPTVEMKDSGVEWLGKVPAHWHVVRLRYLCEIQTGDKDTENAVEDGLYDFFVRSQTVERINTYSNECEAILTAGDGAGVGKVFHYTKGKFSYHQRVYMMSEFRLVAGRYLFLYLRELFYRVALDGGAKSTIDSLRRHHFQNFWVACPPRSEETAIIGEIERLSNEFGDLVAEAENAIALLQERRTALISAAVTGKIDVREHAAVLA